MSPARLLCAAIAMCAAGPLVTSIAHAESRVALVIGNGAYQNVAHLTNSTNDAKLIADALKQDGFGVTLVNDIDRDGLAKALRSFGRQADNADWAVVYYAGHGIEMGGTNYLIPVDARLETDRDVGLEAVPLDQVMSAIEGAHAIRLVILDACRDNPFAATIKRTAGAGRDIGRGLARVEPGQATLVAYSAKDGSIALDGDGADSPYAVALAKHLTEPGIEVEKMFRLVHDDVQDATGKNQEPFVYGALPGRQDFYFLAPTVATTGASLTATIKSDIAPDEATWQRIVTSTDPVDFESFARFFPGSAHKLEADAKARLLRAAAEPKVAVLQPAPPSAARAKDQTQVPSCLGTACAPVASVDHSAGDSPVVQKAILYEQPLNSPLDSTVGVTAVNATVTWRYVENGANGPSIEADLQVPERGLKIKLTIHKNSDSSLPASHLIEIQIDAPADMPGKGITKVPRIVMKPTQGARGQPLVGSEAKVTDGFFWIALSAADADIVTNLALLRARDWIDVPFVYETGQRAILTFEKGTSGGEVFQKAMAAWTTG